METFLLILSAILLIVVFVLAIMVVRRPESSPTQALKLTDSERSRFEFLERMNALKQLEMRLVGALTCHTPELRKYLKKKEVPRTVSAILHFLLDRYPPDERRLLSKHIGKVWVPLDAFSHGSGEFRSLDELRRQAEAAEVDLDRFLKGLR